MTTYPLGDDGDNTEFTATKAYAKGTFVGLGSGGNDDPAYYVPQKLESGETGLMHLGGSVWLPKKASTVVIAKGDKIYVADGENGINTTAASRYYIGRALEASPNGGTAPVKVGLCLP